MIDKFLLSQESNLDSNKHLHLQEDPDSFKHVNSFLDTRNNHSNVNQWHINSTEWLEWTRNLWDDDHLRLRDFELFTQKVIMISVSNGTR